MLGPDRASLVSLNADLCVVSRNTSLVRYALDRSYCAFPYQRSRLHDILDERVHWDSMSMIGRTNAIYMCYVAFYFHFS